MSDSEKPKLGMRPPLGLKRTVETGQVKQSFSHGRSNTVVVEVKKRRIIGRPGEAEPAPAPIEEVKAAPVVAAPAPAVPATPAPPRPMSPLERREQQDRLLREAEESRMNALEEARRRDDRARLDNSDDEKRRVEENRKAAEEEANRPVEVVAPEPEVAPKPEPEVARAQEEEKRFAKPGPVTAARRPEPARPQRPRTGDDRRQAGKLTVTRALDGNEEGARARSLAALKRAREKERRAHGSGQPQAKQIRDVVIPETITVGELANRMAERGNDLVRALFKMGMPSAMGDTLDQDTAELLVAEFGHNSTRVSESDVEIDVAQDVDDEDTLVALITARPRFSMRCAAPMSCAAKRAVSPSISARIR
jgi:translation initiation factor IF-2